MNAASSTASVSNTSNKLKYGAANYINARAGVLLSYNLIRDNGLLIEPLVELAYRHEFDGKGNVSYGGASEKSDLSGGTFEINAGINMQLLKNLYWYGLGSYEASGKVKGWGVQAGIRYAFGQEGTTQTYKAKSKAKKQTQTQKVTTTQQQAAKQQTTSYKAVQTRQSPQPQRVTPVVTTQPQQNKNDFYLMRQLEQQWKQGK